MISDQTIVLRDAREADIPALADLHVRTFRETHGGGPTAALREQQWHTKFESGRLLFCVVLEHELGALVGFASGELHESAELSAYGGELNKIYLLSEYHGHGLGRRLLCAGAERFLRRGVTSMLLFGDAGSPSNGFYEAMLGERLMTPEGEFHGGYGWHDLAALAGICSRLPQAGV
jgi:ribosomal protein S18 acetylase RimI-like enzyme